MILCIMHTRKGLHEHDSNASTFHDIVSQADVFSVEAFGLYNDVWTEGCGGKVLDY